MKIIVYVKLCPYGRKFGIFPVEGNIPKPVIQGFEIGDNGAASCCYRLFSPLNPFHLVGKRLAVVATADFHISAILSRMVEIQPFRFAVPDVFECCHDICKIEEPEIFSVNGQMGFGLFRNSCQFFAFPVLYVGHLG